MIEETYREFKEFIKLFFRDKEFRNDMLKYFFRHKEWEKDFYDDVKKDLESFGEYDEIKSLGEYDEIFNQFEKNVPRRINN